MVYERREVGELKQRFLNYFEGKEPAFLRLISGPSGSGKTLSIRYIFVEIFKEKGEYANNFIYVNGTDMRTPKSTFQYILNQLGGKSAPKDDISTILAHIKKELDEKKRRYIFILDEVDKVYHNSRESPKYLFLHSLNRLETRPRHAILLITNEFNLTKNFSEELTSNMNEEVFEAYTAEDILKILKLRAKYCLAPGSYIEDDLAKIAKETYQNPIGGDKANIRHALNILLNAAIISQEKGTPLGGAIEVAINRARISDLSRLLKKYNNHLILLIRAIAQLKEEASIGLDQYSLYGPDLDIDDIKKIFFNFCKDEGLRHVSDRQLYNYIQQLTDEHLLTRINKARYCFTEDAKEILVAIEKL